VNCWELEPVVAEGAVLRVHDVAVEVEAVEA
jgi:hypothetical protein